MLTRRINLALSGSYLVLNLSRNQDDCTRERSKDTLTTVLASGAKQSLTFLAAAKCDELPSKHDDDPPFSKDIELANIFCQPNDNTYRPPNRRFFKIPCVIVNLTAIQSPPLVELSNFW